jgi:hypothetical protein
VVAQEGGKALLQRAALAPRGLFLQALEGEANPAGPSFARVALDQVREGEAVGEPVVFLLAQ